MNNIELLNKYDFHDSLLDSLSYNYETKELRLEIDFCNWKQVGYDENSPETSIISLIFGNVSDVIIPDFSINSDEIIEFVMLEQGTGVKIVVFSDITKTTYEIVILSNEFEILK